MQKLLFKVPKNNDFTMKESTKRPLPIRLINFYLAQISVALQHEQQSNYK